MKQSEQMLPVFFNGQQEENQDEKREKKQKLVRNEFKRIGKYEMPLIKKQHIDLDKVEP